MSALGQKQTWRDVRRMSALPPKADIGQSSRHSELAANLLTGNGPNFRFFSECALILQANWSDFDSAKRRFESSRPSQLSYLIAIQFFTSRFSKRFHSETAFRCLRRRGVCICPLCPSSGLHRHDVGGLTR